jgi:hypothetical protein
MNLHTNNLFSRMRICVLAALLGIMTAAVFTTLTACDSGGNDSGVSYSIGDRGPAGGFIFYVDKDDQYAGWTYLEAAPADLAGTYEWGGYAYLLEADLEEDPKYSEVIAWYGFDCPTDTAIGTGAANTAKLLADVHHDIPDKYASKAYLAAQAAADYSYGSYDDWFLPSKDELNFMYTNLKAAEPSLGGFQDHLYWSSSQYDSTFAYNQLFASGNPGYGNKGSNLYVRCVRAF